jgi:hypothetical protein
MLTKWKTIQGFGYKYTRYSEQDKLRVQEDNDWNIKQTWPGVSSSHFHASVVMKN